MAPQSRLRRLIRALAHRISGPVIGEAAVEHQCDLAVVFYDVIFSVARGRFNFSAVAASGYYGGLGITR